MRMEWAEPGCRSCSSGSIIDWNCTHNDVVAAKDVWYARLFLCSMLFVPPDVGEPVLLVLGSGGDQQLSLLPSVLDRVQRHERRVVSDRNVQIYRHRAAISSDKSSRAENIDRILTVRTPCDVDDPAIGGGLCSVGVDVDLPDLCALHLPEAEAVFAAEAGDEDEEVFVGAP